MNRNISPELIKFVGEVIFTDETPNWVIELAIEILNSPHNSYVRTVKSVEFFNRIETLRKITRID